MESFEIYEVYDLDGNLKNLFSFDHIDSFKFHLACVEKFGVKPLRISHRWQKQKVVITENKKGRSRNRKLIKTVYCSSGEIGSTAVTVADLR